MKILHAFVFAVCLWLAAPLAVAAQQVAPAYFTKYEHLKMTRTDDGILEIRFHTNGGPITFTGRDHREFVEAFYLVSQDRDNKVVILTGTGNEWMAKIDFASLGDITNPREWDAVIWEGQKMLQNLLDINVPVIAAINGPALLHSEYALTADILLASEGAYFQDLPHLAGGIVPGDGMQVMWPRVLGPQRAKYFLYTQQKLTAREAQQLGVVAEVLPTNEALAARSLELARQLLKIPELTRRYMRTVFAQPLKREVLEQVGYGLALEGISATDLKVAAELKAKEAAPAAGKKTNRK